MSMSIPGIDRLHWFGGSSFRWDGTKTVYFDPWKLNGKTEPKADIIFISHEHFDHYSPEDVASIASKKTVIVCSKAVYGELGGSGISVKETRPLDPGQEASLPDIKIKAIASYNIGKAFHARDSNKLGFVVNMDGISIYHAGDTDRIPEMKDIACDIALLPVGGTYTMNADEAASAALDIKPKIAVPMHYGDSVGSARDAGRLKELLEGKIEVKILPKER